METADWLTFDDPRFALAVRYPAVTPAGHPVTVETEAPEGISRAHLLAQQEK